jgi:hypothetical protein
VRDHQPNRGTNRDDQLDYEDQHNSDASAEAVAIASKADFWIQPDQHGHDERMHDCNEINQRSPQESGQRVEQRGQAKDQRTETAADKQLIDGRQLRNWAGEHHVRPRMRDSRAAAQRASSKTAAQ